MVEENKDNEKNIHMHLNILHSALNNGFSKES